MKKTIAKLFGYTSEPQTPTTPVKAQAQLAVRPDEVDAMYGSREGYAFVIYFPEYQELVPWLSDQARIEFIKGFSRCVSEVTNGLIHLADIPETALATIAVHATEKQTPAVAAKMMSALDKELQIWTGTFGRIGMPMLKFRVGVVRDQMILAAIPPKVLGSAAIQASEIAKSVCDQFDIRIATTADLIRSSSDVADWFDIDDCRLPTDLGDKPKTKTLRVFTTLNDLRLRGDVEILRAARKAYFSQNWEEASEKFDRISRVASLRRIAEVYGERIQVLRAGPKRLDWDGVYRNGR